MHKLMITPAFFNFYEHYKFVLNIKENMKTLKLEIKENFTITASTTTLHVSTLQRNRYLLKHFTIPNDIFF